MLQLLFMGAELFFAVYASNGKIRRIRETLGMGVIGDLPFDEQRQGGQDQNQGEGVDDVLAVGLADDDEDKWGEDHREVPVVDAASGTTTVVHHPRLEGAEEQDADHVAYGIEKRDEHQDALVDGVGEIKNSKDRVQSRPAKEHHQGDFPGLEHRFFFAARKIVAFMLLLTSHRGGFGGDEAFDHLADEGKGDESDDDPGCDVGEIKEGDVVDAEENVVNQNPKQQRATIEQANVIQLGDYGDSDSLRVHKIWTILAVRKSFSIAKGNRHLFLSIFKEMSL